MNSTRTNKSRPRAAISARAKPLDLAASERVSRRPLSESAGLAHLVEPNLDGVDLVAWATDNEAEIRRALAQHPALLFRGFGIDSVDAFEAFVGASSHGERLAYQDRSTPRTTEGNRIYTSTIYPADQRINLHNEGTYWARWPLKLFFCCLTPSVSGGQTPLADVRRVYERIDSATSEAFKRRQMMLVRNYNDGFGLTWQEVFQVDSKAEVERYCRSNRIDLEWRGNDRLRTRQVRPAVRHHPGTGLPVWFNHVAFFHYTTLDATLRDALVSEFGIESLPYNTCYGDGGAIDAQVVEHIRQAYEAETVAFDWQAGDVLLLDNMCVAHGRESFRGERRLLAAMAEPYSDEHEAGT